MSGTLIARSAMSVPVDSSTLEDSAAIVQRLQNPAGDAALPPRPPPPPISPRAMEVIKTLDSRSFGFLDFQQSSSDSGSSCNTITKDFIRQGIAKLQVDLTSGPQTDTFRGEVFCQLGHLHLLLEEYKEALSAYQHYQQWCPESGMHTPFLYGLGLIFYHINAHKWATEAFQKVLQLAPNFARSNEIHLHLGVMCKMKGETAAGLQHFQKALSIPGPSSLSKFEIQFHIGYLYYMAGQFMAAKETLEGILMAKSVPNDIKAMALRQLGWLYHTNPEMAHPSENPLKKAIELLKLAAGADPTCGQTWYFLGRCHAAQGRAHEAFLAYQQAVNKSAEDQADTWCSIGILYHNMCQPRDSLQSYLCAVYLDTDHLSAWTNMGCLYESVTQPVDALVCYRNAFSAKMKGELKYELTNVKSAEFIHSRIMNLEQFVALMGPTIASQPRSLPSVLEGWQSLIPRHIKLRKPCPDTPMLQLPAAGPQNMSSFTLPGLPCFATLPLPSNGLSNYLHGPAAKRPRNMDPIILRSMNDSWLNGPGLVPPPSPLPPYPYTPVLAPNPGSMMSTGMGMTNPRMGGLDGMPPMEPGQSSLGAGMGIGLSGMQDAGNRMGDLGVGPLMLKGRSPPSYPHGTTGSVVDGYRTNSILPTTFSSLSSLHSSAANSPHFEPHVRDHEFDHLMTNLDDNVPKRPTDLDLHVLPLKRNFPFPSPTPTPHNITTSNLNHLVDLRSSLNPPSLCSPGNRHTSTAPTLQTVSPTYSQMSEALSEHSTGSTPTALPPTRYTLDRSQLTSSTVHKNHTLGVSVPPNPSSSASSVFQPSEGCSITLMNRQPYLPNFDKTNHRHPQPAGKNFSKPHFTGGFVNGQHVPRDLPTANLNSPPDSKYISQMQRSHSGNHGNSHTSRQVSNPLLSPLAAGNRLPGHVPSDLPGDLSLVTPLGFGSEAPGMDDYLQQYLDEGRENGRRGGEHGTDGPRQHSIPKEGLSPGGKFPGINSPLGTVKSRKFSESPKAFQGKWQKRSSIGSLEGVSTPLSPLHTLLVSPPSKEDSQNSPNNTHDIKKVSNTALTSVHGVHGLAHSPERRPDHMLQGVASTSNRKRVSGRSPAQQPTSPLQHHAHLTTTNISRSPTQDDIASLSESIVVVDTGAFSDGCSSSGVSSAGSKLSSSSDSNSPIDSSGIATSSPKVTSPDCPSQSMSRFNYPLPDSDTESESSLLSPIHEPFPALREEGEYMVHDPTLRPPDPPRHSRETDLNPKVPIYEAQSREDALSERLHAFCTKPESHICMIRGIAPALGLDLNLFSTDALVATCADHEMEVREQIQQAADENWDPAGRRQVWKCESSKSLTTIKEYASYQRKVLEEREVGNRQIQEDSTSGSGSDSDGGQKRKKLLQFGTNVDLSDQDKWRDQLRELDKLPKFLRVLCPEGNFLAHIGHTILGMNSVQLYMKVPGSRTPGHQENNNCCSVNVNIGPGDCEWFAVPNQYWGIMHDLCEKHKISFLVGSWWPILKELHEHNVPVFRFTQYVGDIVWINPGTVHWVQANSVCNNIAWNIGPLTAHQFRLSWERYQWNKIQRVRSIVPMIHLTWNFARRVKINNPILYQQVRSLMESSLMQTHSLTAQLKSANVPILWHGKAEGEPAPCCNNCLEEVFNVLFVLNRKGEYRVYCHKCAGAIRKPFTVLQQYNTEELESVLASFKLHQPEST